MIHLLKVGPNQSAAQVKKLARRFAMTGGFEVALEDGLTAADLGVLVERYLAEYREHKDTGVRRTTNNAYRILSLVKEHPAATRELVQILNRELV